MGKRKVSEPEEGSAEYTSDSDPKTKTKAKAKGKQKVIPSIKVFIAVQATIYMELNAYQKPTKKQLDSESESASESGSESEDEGPIAKKAKREVRAAPPVSRLHDSLTRPIDQSGRASSQEQGRRQIRRLGQKEACHRSQLQGDALARHPRVLRSRR